MPMVDKVRANETTYNIQDTELRTTVSVLRNEYDLTVSDLSAFKESTNTSINDLSSLISSVDSTLDSKIDDTKATIENKYDEEITDIKTVNDNQDLAITGVQNRCTSLESSVSIIQENLLVSPKIQIISQSDYESLEDSSTVDNYTLYLVWTPNILERLYYHGTRLDIIPYIPVDFSIDYFYNNNYWNVQTIESIEFISRSVIKSDIKITGNTKTPAYVDNNNVTNIKIYTESEHFVINNLSDCFKNCTSLTSAKLDKVIVTTFDRAFKGCSSLVSITSPNSPANTESSWIESFAECSNLIEIHVGGTVLSSCLYKCPNLTTVYIESDSVSDVTNIIGVGDEEFPGDRDVTFYVSENGYNSLVTAMKLENADIFGELYGHLDIDKWQDLENGCYYEDGNKKVTILINE